MPKTKIKLANISVLFFTALLCFTACTPRQIRMGQNTDTDINNVPKVQDEQANIKEPDTKFFFGEEYIERENVEFPKHVLKNIPTGTVKKQEYRLVTPTQEEIDGIAVRLDPILSMLYLSS